MASRNYSEKLKRDQEASRKRSRAGRDVAEDYPPKGNARRRRSCERDLRRFLETYFPATFSLPWSSDHPRVIARLQECILDGGLFALGMPRGSGKSSLAVRGCLWALLYGHRRFVVVVAATEKKAEDRLKDLKVELEVNDLLAKDFRHVCHPIRRLENNGRRCAGQLFRGEQTRVVWASDRIVFPTVPDDDCDGANVSGACVSVVGITGALRGQSITTAAGEVLRPDLVLLDDVQDRESAQSAAQTAERLAIIRGDVLGLAGPGRSISALLTATVIRPDDLSDQMLDRDRNPAWHGERTRSVYGWPAETQLWEHYLQLRRDAMKADRPTAEATAFYLANREAMDRGAVVAWPERRDPGDVSAIQHEMHLRADLGEEAYAAEYQNEPARAESLGPPTLTAAEIAAKLNRLPRGVVPLRASRVTAAIDLQDALLYYAVAAWDDGFTGSLIAYGTYPRQPARDFTLRRASPTLRDAAPGSGREGAIRAGLERLVADLMGRDWAREDGAALRVERLLIDCGYLPDVVYEFIRNHPHAAALLASRGFGVGPAMAPMTEWPVKEGERHGWNWVIGKAAGRSGRVVKFDAHHWKSFVHARLAVAPGDVGSLSLYGADPEEHQLFARHLVAEAPVRTSAAGRTVDVWAVKPGAGDNHYLDVCVAAAAAASIQGACLASAAAPPKPKPPRKTLAQLQQEARQRQGR